MDKPTSNSEPAANSDANWEHERRYSVSTLATWTSSRLEKTIKAIHSFLKQKKLHLLETEPQIIQAGKTHLRLFEARKHEFKVKFN